jgi:hypothetical protein
VLGVLTQPLSLMTRSSTRVTITEDGDVSNLFFRLMSRYVFGCDGSMKKVPEGPDDNGLAAKFDKAPRPSAVLSRGL